MTDEPATTSLKSLFMGRFRVHVKHMILHPELTPEQVADAILRAARLG